MDGVWWQSPCGICSSCELKEDIGQSGVWDTSYLGSPVVA